MLEHFQKYHPDILEGRESISTMPEKDLEMLQILAVDEVREWSQFGYSIENELGMRAMVNCTEHDFYAFVDMAESGCGAFGVHELIWHEPDSKYPNKGGYWTEKCDGDYENGCGSQFYDEDKLPSYVKSKCKKCRYLELGVENVNKKNHKL